jgi:hypothetical protein
MHQAGDNDSVFSSQTSIEVIDAAPLLHVTFVDRFEPMTVHGFHL